MRTCKAVLYLALIALAAFSPPAYAQEATLSGSITDASGGVLPGVTINIVQGDTGNTLSAVTDERGGFRLPMRVGEYRVTAEPPGFATINRTVSLLVGQTVVLNLQMETAALEESIVVSGQAPLIDVTRSTVGKAIDSRQVRDLPVNGRNWVDLAMLAPGSRLNASTDEPGTLVGTVGVGTFQLNVDGLRVTQNQTSGFGQPKYSKDSIAEFEFVSSRFDATQGGSMGVQVNAITKSGTNIPSGSFSGYFRDDALVGKDFVQDRVLPYSNQQWSWTFGGPIRKDRATSSSTTSSSGSRRRSRIRASIRASTSTSSIRSPNARAACGSTSSSRRGPAERAWQQLGTMGTLRHATPAPPTSLVGDRKHA